jgi:hypothetical protein
MIRRTSPDKLQAISAITLALEFEFAILTAFLPFWIGGT